MKKSLIIIVSVVLLISISAGIYIYAEKKVESQKIKDCTMIIEQMKAVKECKILIENNTATVYVKRFVTGGYIDEHYIKQTVYDRHIKGVHSVSLISK